MSDDTLHTERSPLLGEQRNGHTNGQQQDGLKSNGTVTHREEEEGRNGEEDAARLAQYEGLPEAQKLLKYIVPSVSVGV
jgi:hypothetical protein